MKFVSKIYGPARIVQSQYTHGGLAIQLFCENGEPLARMSRWLEDSPNLPSDCFYLKDWSENAELAAEMIEQGLIAPATDLEPRATGYVVAYPYRLVNQE